MINPVTNYDKTKMSMAHVFLQYNQTAMIYKYSLEHDSDWLYITFVNRIYRISRKTGSVQWSDNDSETVHEADDEFPASLQVLADKNILDYMHYETLMFALTHLFCRLKEEMWHEKR